MSMSFFFFEWPIDWLHIIFTYRTETQTDLLTSAYCTQTSKTCSRGLSAAIFLQACRNTQSSCWERVKGFGKSDHSSSRKASLSPASLLPAVPNTQFAQNILIILIADVSIPSFLERGQFFYLSCWYSACGCRATYGSNDIVETEILTSPKNVSIWGVLVWSTLVGTCSCYILLSLWVVVVFVVF